MRGRPLHAVAVVLAGLLVTLYVLDYPRPHDRRNPHTGVRTTGSSSSSSSGGIGDGISRRGRVMGAGAIGQSNPGGARLLAGLGFGAPRRDAGAAAEGGLGLGRAEDTLHLGASELDPRTRAAAAAQEGPLAAVLRQRHSSKDGNNSAIPWDCGQLLPNQQVIAVENGVPYIDTMEPFQVSPQRAMELAQVKLLKQSSASSNQQQQTTAAQPFICVPSATSPSRMEAPIGIFKIYVYKRILNAMPTRDECRDSLQIMWYEEIELPYWIRDSIHHTDNPEEAHFFYIPTMVKCLFNLNRARFNETRQFLISVRHLHRSPYFHRNNGHDHALLNPGGGSYNVTSSVLHGSYLFGRGAGHYSNVTKLLTEAYRPYAYFAGRDIIVPGYPDDAFFSYQETYQDALRERRRLFLYTGGVQLSYQRRQLGRLAELLKIPSAKSSFYAPLVLLQTRKVSSNKFEYQQLVKDFTFCAAPRGTSPWTQRFYDAAIVGCIPVLFDRNFVLPFPNQIDWDSIVVRFSEDFSHSFSFLDHLYQLSQDVEAIRERRRKLADVTSILYYGLAVNATQPAAVTPEAFSDPDPVVRREAYKYSPYSMIVRELSDRYCTLRHQGVLP